MKTIKFKQKPTELEYVKLINGVFNLTDKEVEILAKFMELQKQYPNLYVFSADMKKTVAQELSIDNFNTLNIYIKSFKTKKAINQVKGQYVFHTLLDLSKINDGITFQW